MTRLTENIHIELFDISIRNFALFHFELGIYHLLSHIKLVLFGFKIYYCLDRSGKFCELTEDEGIAQTFVFSFRGKTLFQKNTGWRNDENN